MKKRDKKRRFVPAQFDDAIKKESKRRKKTETDVLMDIANGINKKKGKKRGIFEWDFKV